MNNDALKISNLYDLNETIAAKVFEALYISMGSTCKDW